MNKIGIFYGSTTGYTADAATNIAEDLGVQLADVYNVAQTAPDKLGDYDVILLGASTWGAGDVQEDMEEFIDGASALDLAGKKMAFFGCGDESMADTFCGAVGTMYERMKGTGAEMIGAFNADGYDFNESSAKIDGAFVGLVLDDVNHPEMTPDRIKAWTDELKKQI